MRLNSRLFSSVSTKSFLFGLVIVCACLAFVMTGFGSFSLGGLTGMSPNTAAEVNGQPIDMQQFASVVNAQGNASENADRTAVAMQTLRQLILQKILVQQAHKIGWEATKEELLLFIRSLPLFQNPSTGQFDPQIFKNFIANQQMGEVGFYNMLEDQIKIQKFQTLEFLPLAIDNKLFDIQHIIDETAFSLKYAVIEVPDSAIQSELAQKVQNALKDPKELEELKTQYNRLKNEFQQPAKVRARSILISYKSALRAQGDALGRTQEQAKQKIEALAKELQAGTAFATLATTENDDLIAKNNQGDIGFIDSTSIDPASAKALFALSAAQPLSSVVETPYGYRLFQFEESRPAVSKSFDEVKASLAEKTIKPEIKAEANKKLLQQTKTVLASQDTKKIDEFLSQNGILWVKAKTPYSLSQPIVETLGSSDELSHQIFSLQKPGQILLQPIQFAGRFALIQLDSRTPPKPLTESEKEHLKIQTQLAEAQSLASSLEQNLFTSYEKKGDIVINPILLGQK